MDGYILQKYFIIPIVIAHIPMDFYYQGKAKNGDVPPRKGFAEKHPLLLNKMPDVRPLF